MTKKELRQLMKQRLACMSASERDEKSRVICELLVQQPQWRNAQTVCFFAPQSAEPNLDLLWEEASTAAKRVCYPRMNERRLDLIIVDHFTTLAESRWKLREPVQAQGELLACGEVQLLLVPGLAFGADGSRLGRGGGYYDRLIAEPELCAFKIGICFDEQFLPELPIEEHDREVDQVLSERGLRL
jgi:5-formyltetrahydrofolate cyclo-ligase